MASIAMVRGHLNVASTASDSIARSLPDGQRVRWLPSPGSTYGRRRSGGEHDVLQGWRDGLQQPPDVRCYQCASLAFRLAKCLTCR